VNPGDIVLIPLPQVGGGPPKLRPALLLARLPGAYQNLLLCGISTQIHALHPGWDELIHSTDADFSGSGLHRDSAVRLSYLCAVDSNEVLGGIGRIATDRLERLLTRLSEFLKP